MTLSKELTNLFVVFLACLLSASGLPLVAVFGLSIWYLQDCYG